MESEQVMIPGVPDLGFRRSRWIFRGEGNSKYANFYTNRTLLTGCNCFVMGPNDVAYLSDISGKPVCRRCAAVCDCGHKVAPQERVSMGRRHYVCKMCHEKELRRQRMDGIKQLLLGPFIHR